MSSGSKKPQSSKTVILDDDEDEDLIVPDEAECDDKRTENESENRRNQSSFTPIYIVGQWEDSHWETKITLAILMLSCCSH